MKTIRFTGSFTLVVDDNGIMDTIPLAALECTEIDNYAEYESLDIFGKQIANIKPFVKYKEALMHGGTFNKKDFMFEAMLLDGNEIVLKMHNTMAIGSQEEAWARCDRVGLQSEFWEYGKGKVARELSELHKKNQDTYAKTVPDYSECYD